MKGPITLFKHLILFSLLVHLIIGCESNVPGTTSTTITNNDTVPVIDSLVQMADYDLDSIVKRGSLIAVMDNSLSSMFLYRGIPLGFEYELISRFADSIGLDLEVKFTKNLEEGMQMLNEGKCDIIAHNLTITQERRKIVDFTDPQHEVHQVLVQRKPSDWRKMKLHEIDKMLILNPIGLIGKKIHVRKGSSFAARLRNLSDEIGGEIEIIEMDDMDTEEIIELVAKGEIAYTVADDNIAKLYSRFYPILDLSLKISFPQQVAWGVRKNASNLKAKINEWQSQEKKTSAFNDLYNKYFRNNQVPRDLVQSEFLSKDGKSLSPYDSLIKVSAATIGWDWRMLAAQISKESQFNPEAESWMGAVGLMQVMPKTAKEYGIKNLKDPNKNMMAGTIHIQWLEERWKHLPDSVERLKFVLGSYNVGHGHVWDAVRLTKKYGGDPLKWDDVSKYLKLKSKEKYHQDEVVEFGYCRGEEPVEYVSEIFHRFDRYIQMENDRRK